MDREQALRERLQVVIARHSQAKIAAATGFSRANVSQYAKATRIPASFLSALVATLGVNPAWMLTGQGMPFELDVIPHAAKGKSVEELVSSLKAITKLKFGELVGKAELEDLRRMSDALAEYQEHHDAVRLTFASLFTRYEEAIGQALGDKDFELLDSLVAVAKELALLCRDRDNERRILHYQAQGAYYRGDFEASLEAHQQLFLEELAYDGEGTFGRIGPIIDHVLALNAAYQRAEALRVADSALLLLSAYRDHDQFVFLRSIAAYIRFSIGEVSAALPELTSSYSLLSERYKTRNLHTLRIPMLVAGACDFSELEGVVESFAFANEHSRAIFAAHSLAYGAMLEDEKALKRAFKTYRLPIEAAGTPFPIPSLYQAKYTLDAMSGDKSAWRRYLKDPDIEKIANSSIRGDQISMRLVAEQIARIAGEGKAAKALTLEVVGIYEGLKAGEMLSSLSQIAYADALAAHFASASQRRTKSAPTSSVISQASRRVVELRGLGWALLDQHPRFAQICAPAKRSKHE